SPWVAGWVVVPRLPSAARSSRLPPGPPRRGTTTHPARRRLALVSAHHGRLPAVSVRDPGLGNRIRSWYDTAAPRLRVMGRVAVASRPCRRDNTPNRWSRFVLVV